MSSSKVSNQLPSLSASSQESVGRAKAGTDKIFLADFFRKLAILILAVLIGNPLSLLLVGLINRLFFRVIDTAFVCYAANEYYRYKYWFRFANPISRVYPTIIGIYFQGGKLGLIFGITSIEKDFRHAPTLALFMRNVNLVKKLLGIKAFHYSGVLPTELAKHSLVAKEYLVERCEIVAKVVLAAEKQVRLNENVVGYLPIILLGGRGNVGRKIAEGLKESGRLAHILDVGDEIPQQLVGKKCVVIDVARRGALEEHIGKFWDGMIFLNETYPAPKKTIIDQLKSLNIPCYHVSGVTAKAFPSFPGPYSKGVPCCALINDNNLQAVVRAI